MKKITVFILGFLMLFVVSACGNRENTQDKAKEDNTNSTEIENKNEKSQKKEETKQVILDATFKVPMENIYIDVPDYQEIEQGYTELFIVHESRYVAITPAYDSTATDAKDARNKTFDIFARNMQNYEGGINGIDISVEENKTINGTEVYFFEGTINYGTDNIHEGYAIGYSFIVDGIPCQIIGSVIDEEQSTELKEEIKEIVEAMMQSVRSEQ